MEVISVNLGERKPVLYRGKTVFTGIFKYPVNQPIILGDSDVGGDAVVDRKYHGGINKACYIYSADHYKYWKTLYPDLDWNYGMMGENITVKGLDESSIQIGDIFYIGDCRVQVTQPRQPCFKLGIRFGSQKIVKQFMNSRFPGIYVKVIEGGKVEVGDNFSLSERLHNTIGLLEIWDLLYSKEPNHDDLEFAINFQHVPDNVKKTLIKRLDKLRD